MMIDREVGCDIGWVRVDIASATMGRSKMEDNFIIPKGIYNLGKCTILQVHFQEPYFRQAIPEILQCATAQIVYHSDPRTHRNQTVDKMATDKTGTTGDENRSEERRVGKESRSTWAAR